MFRRSKNLRDLFGGYISPDRMESILKGGGPTDSNEVRNLNFVWIWFADEQVAGPEFGSAVDLASSAGGFIDIFPPIAALWFGLFETGADITKIVHDLMQFTNGGAKIIHGTTSGSTVNVGSPSRMSYSVVSPDRSAILSRLAAAERGSISTFNAIANTTADSRAYSPESP